MLTFQDDQVQNNWTRQEIKFYICFSLTTFEEYGFLLQSYSVSLYLIMCMALILHC